MKTIRSYKKLIVMVILLSIALTFNHINGLSMILGDDWIGFCIARSFHRNHVEFKGMIKSNVEEEQSMDIIGDMTEQVLTFTLLQNYLELVSFEINLEEETISLESILGSLEDISYGDSMSQDFDLKNILIKDMEVNCISRHIVENHCLMDIYLMNDGIYIATDYTGQILKVWGELTEFYTFELEFFY